MRSPYPRQPLSGTLDVNGNLTIANQLMSPQGFWSLVYLAAQVSTGAPAWSVLLGTAASAAPLVYGNGQQVILGPFLLLPGERAAILLSGGAPNSTLVGQAMGWQSDTDPSELLGLTPFTTSLFFPPSLVASVAVTNIPAVTVVNPTTNPANVDLISGSGALLGDTTAAVLAPDSATETASNATGAVTATLASLKSSGGTPALVGVAGAPTVGSSTQVIPPFGQATVATHCLVVGVGVSGAASEPTTTAAGWVKLKSGSLSGGWAALWMKPNCGNGETAPTFTCNGAGTEMVAQAAEFLNVAAAPTDQSATASGSLSVTVTNPAVDAATLDLVLLFTRWFTSGLGTTFTDVMNNGATFTQLGQMVGAAGNRPSNFAFAVVPALKTAAALGISSFAMPSWPGKYDGQGSSQPAAGTKATVTLAANATHRWVADSFNSSAIQISGAAAPLAAQLIDGASGGANKLDNAYSSVTATAGSAAAGSPARTSGARFANAVINTALTMEFTALVAGVEQAVSLGAYLQ